MRVHHHWMIRRDMPEVLAIEHASFDTPWSEEQFLQVLSQRNAIGMVAEYDERIAGFMIYELHKFSLHLMEFAVHPDFRRQGVGQQMIKKLVSMLSRHRRVSITLKVREKSLDAQLFYRSCGFKAYGVWKDYYKNEGQDAYEMAYTLESEVLV